MNINFDILEQFRRYFNGELSQAEAHDLENKMTSDDVYAYHLRAFKTLSQGIGQSWTPDTEWMKDLQNKPVPESEIRNIEKIIAAEKASSRRRIFVFMALLILVIAGIALLVSKPWEPAGTNVKPAPPNHLQANEPGEEEEPLIGSTGISVLYDIEQRIYNAGPPPAPIGQKNRVIHLQAQNAREMKYLFQSDTLVLYSDNVDKFNRASFDWITLQSNGVTENYIKIDTGFYDIPYTKDKQMLKRADKEKSEILKTIRHK